MDLRYEFLSKKGVYSTLEKSPSEFLEEYLELAKNNEFKLILTDEFLRALGKCNLPPHPGPRIDSERATGSPPKNKK